MMHLVIGGVKVCTGRRTGGPVWNRAKRGVERRHGYVMCPDRYEITRTGEEALVIARRLSQQCTTCDSCRDAVGA